MKKGILKQIIIRLKKVVELLKRLIAKQQQAEVKKIPVMELAKAMAEMEGFGVPGALPTRNHNPGDLRESKYQLYQKDGFAYFPDDETGWKAFIYDLCVKINGHSVTGLTPESSLKDLIYKWTATDQHRYLMFVSARLGASFGYKIKNFTC